METPPNLEHQLTEMIHDSSKTNTNAANLAMKGFSNFYLSDFASEVDIIDHTIKHIPMNITKETKILPTEFLLHYNENTLSPEEIEWAASAFDDARNHSIPYFSEFMVGGKPLFSPEEISAARTPEDENKLKAKVIAEVLKGNPVEEMNEEKHTKELFSPQISDTRSEERTFLEKIVDFFKELLGIGVKEKQMENAMLDQMKENANINEENYSGTYTDLDTLNEHREKITFEELSAEHAVDKVTKAVKNSPALNKNLSKGK